MISPHEFDFDISINISIFGEPQLNVFDEIEVIFDILFLLIAVTSFLE